MRQKPPRADFARAGAISAAGTAASMGGFLAGCWVTARTGRCVMAENPWTYLDAPDLDRLDLASVVVREALDTPYLVGSCLTRPDYRDVDIRVVLADERYDELFKPAPHRDALRHMIQVAVTEHYVRATGLRIDFQIQRRTEAQKHEGVRHPLGLYPHLPKAAS